MIADRGFDADYIRSLVCEQSVFANIPPRAQNADCFSPFLASVRATLSRVVQKRGSPLGASPLATTNSLARSEYGCLWRWRKTAQETFVGNGGSFNFPTFLHSLSHCWNLWLCCKLTFHLQRGCPRCATRAGCSQFGYGSAALQHRNPRCSDVSSGRRGSKRTRVHEAGPKTR